MSNLESEIAVQIPPRLQRRPVFRGVPVPYTVFIRDDGRPEFRVLDTDHWRQAAARRLCGLCGEPQDHWIWFIGGEKCLKSWPGKMHQTGVFADLGMHEECARYAAKVCPFLSGAHTDYKGTLPRKGGAPVLVLDGGMTRPDRLGLFRTRDYKVLPGMPLRVATTAIFDVEWFWNREESEAVR